MAIYTHSYYGLMVSTGDIICTRDGEENSLFGKLWGLLGKLVPGEVDHAMKMLTNHPPSAFINVKGYQVRGV